MICKTGRPVIMLDINNRFYVKFSFNVQICIISNHFQVVDIKRYRYEKGYQSLRGSHKIRRWTRCGPRAVRWTGLDYAICISGWNCLSMSLRCPIWGLSVGLLLGLAAHGRKATPLEPPPKTPIDKPGGGNGEENYEQNKNY